MDFGLFRTTPVEALLYPNPAAASVQDNPAELFAFLGRILGKALYEGWVNNTLTCQAAHLLVARQQRNMEMP